MVLGDCSVESKKLGCKPFVDIMNQKLHHSGEENGRWRYVSISRPLLSPLASSQVYYEKMNNFRKCSRLFAW